MGAAPSRLALAAQSIHESAAKGRLKKEHLKNYVQSGGKIDEPLKSDSSKKTLLMKIVTRSQRDCQLGLARYCVDSLSANVDARSKKGQTALMLAAHFGNLEIVKYFTNRWSKNVDDTDKNGNTALMLAASAGNQKVVRHLLFTCKANPNIKNKRGKTALDVVREDNLQAKQTLELASGKFLATVFFPDKNLRQPVWLKVTTRGVTFQVRTSRVSPRRKKEELLWDHDIKLNISSKSVLTIVSNSHVSCSMVKKESVSDLIRAENGIKIPHEEQCPKKLKIYLFDLSNVDATRQSIIQTISCELPSYEASCLVADYNSSRRKREQIHPTKLKSVHRAVKKRLDEISVQISMRIKFYDTKVQSCKEAGDHKAFSYANTKLKTLQNERIRMRCIYQDLSLPSSLSSEEAEDCGMRRMKSRVNSEPLIFSGISVDANQIPEPSAPSMPSSVRIKIEGKEGEVNDGQYLDSSKLKRPSSKRRHSEPNSCMLRKRKGPRSFAFSKSDIQKYRMRQAPPQFDQFVAQFGKLKFEQWERESFRSQKLRSMKQIRPECSRLRVKKKIERNKAQHYRQWGQNFDQAHECRYCTAIFREKVKLTNHVTEEHSGDKKYVCRWDGCSQKFARKQGMISHLKTHSLDRPHVCPQSGCGKAFSRRNNLSRHMRTHLGIKPFQCFECQKKFSTKSNLQTHLKTHGKQSRFRCEYCGRVFVRQSYYGKHILKHTNSGEMKNPKIVLENKMLELEGHQADVGNHSKQDLSPKREVSTSKDSERHNSDMLHRQDHQNVSSPISHLFSPQRDVISPPLTSYDNTNNDVLPLSATPPLVTPSPHALDSKQNSNSAIISTTFPAPEDENTNADYNHIVVFPSNGSTTVSGRDAGIAIGAPMSSSYQGGHATNTTNATKTAISFPLFKAESCLIGPEINDDMPSNQCHTKEFESESRVSWECLPNGEEQFTRQTTPRRKKNVRRSAGLFHPPIPHILPTETTRTNANRNINRTNVDCRNRLRRQEGESDEQKSSIPVSDSDLDGVANFLNDTIALPPQIGEESCLSPFSSIGSHFGGIDVGGTPLNSLNNTMSSRDKTSQKAPGMHVSLPDELHVSDIPSGLHPLDILGDSQNDSMLLFDSKMLGEEPQHYGQSVQSDTMDLTNSPSFCSLHFLDDHKQMADSKSNWLGTALERLHNSNPSLSLQCNEHEDEQREHGWEFDGPESVIGADLVSRSDEYIESETVDTTSIRNVQSYFSWAPSPAQTIPTFKLPQAAQSYESEFFQFPSKLPLFSSPERTHTFTQVPDDIRLMDIDTSAPPNLW